MLARVLKSHSADKVHRLMVDTFVILNEMILTHKAILLKLEELEKKVAAQDEKVLMLFDFLKQFLQ
jgi:hypothetical protein